MRKVINRSSLIFILGFSQLSAAPSFEKDMLPYLEANCIRCHGPKKQKGDFRLDDLSREVGIKDTPLWHEVMERISSGECPLRMRRIYRRQRTGIAIVGENHLIALCTLENVSRPKLGRENRHGENHANSDQRFHRLPVIIVFAGN